MRSPAALPEAVLLRAQAELLDWHGKGLSVMEMSHRSDEFVSIANKAEQDLRDLLSIPSNYKVLFLQGGASQQFAQIALNLLPENGKADYIDTGIWSQKAIEEASRYGTINVAASAKLFGFPRAIAHGMWLKARALAALEDHLPASNVEISVQFQKPVRLPADVTLSASAAGSHGEFRVEGQEGIVHMIGSWQPATD
ncbi:aminotransferase class V-fold PLP-dependent enzyme [Pseudomonas syringae pv. actinidiae]|nr:aminotransferase class V-fold PLP-dependent enzyme [Pseudomonas syringae pv. actinidiae]